MRSVFLAAILVTGLAAPVAAQQPTQPVSGGDEQTMLFAAGLTFLDASDTGIGFGANALFNALSSSEHGRLGIVGDFGLNDLDYGTVVTFMGGPRYTFSTAGKIVPYGQFLVGFVHCCGDTDFKPLLGFGADIAWKPNLNFRGEISFIFADSNATRFFLGVSLPINK